MEQFFDEIDVSEDHTTTAVTLKIEFCQSFSFGSTVEEESEVGVPFVTDDFTAREAANGNDHFAGMCSIGCEGKAG